MRNNGQKHTILLYIITICIACFAAGCKEIPSGKDKAVYEYEDTAVADCVSIEKSVYSDERLDIYIEGDIDDSFQLSGCYNTEFELIDCTWETAYSNGKYSIIGEKASEISGIKIENYSVRYRIRYLDSDQYAIMWDYDVTEIGWLSFGDENAFYTEEELAEKERAQSAYLAEQEKNFTQFEGKWYAPDDSNLYMIFYRDDSGNYKLDICRPDGSGGYITETIHIDEIDIEEQYDGEKELVILDGISWGCRYTYGLSEDMQSLFVGYRDKTVYERQ